MQPQRNVNQVDDVEQQHQYQQQQELAPTISAQAVESVWMIGQVEVTIGEQQPKIQKERRRSCASEAPEAAYTLASMAEDVCAIDGQAMTREAGMEFNEVDVRQPLASAACVARAGNGMWLDENRGYIQNMITGECMMVRIGNGTYVFDVELDNGDMTKVTLDSGAGRNVWPKGKAAGTSKVTPKKSGVNMIAANGTQIGHYGQRQLRFRGIQTKPGFCGRV